MDARAGKLQRHRAADPARRASLNFSSGWEADIPAPFDYRK
jgi:hypothetical protein